MGATVCAPYMGGFSKANLLHGRVAFLRDFTWVGLCIRDFTWTGPFLEGSHMGGVLNLVGYGRVFDLPSFT